jgi:uncharacterized metal-binding protein YceD (DUF177 family)
MSTFNILIDRLKGGQTLKIEEKADPAFLGPDEPELLFKTPVTVKGEAYLTDDHLILHLKATTQATMPCAVCNTMIKIELKVENFYHTEPVEEIRSAVYDFSEVLREALLIELPRTVECNGGKCPDRATIEPFLRPQDRTNFPFADINKEDLK